MNNDLISIVVPIYKVEKYLEENIKSLLNQTYKNIEIILVDDGSPDDCGRICDEYANKDNRIKVIHKENGGLSDARNHGIDLATGKYIVFIDSDDYVDARYTEMLYNAIKTNNAKVSQCNILKVNDEGGKLKKVGYLDNQIKTGKDMLIDLYNGHATENIVVWNKMYAIELFENLRYPVGKVHEDEYTTYKIFYNTDKVAIINEYLYNYRQNENSITGKEFNVKRLDRLEAWEERMTFFEEKNEKELYEMTLLTYFFEIRKYYMYAKKYLNESKGIHRDLIKKHRKTYKKVWKLKQVSYNEKIRWLFLNFFPNLYYVVKKQEMN